MRTGSVSGTPPARRLATWSVWPLAVAVPASLALGVVVAIHPPAGTSLLLVATAAAAIAPLAWRVMQRRFDPFEPVLLFALGWCAMFVIRPAAMVSNNDYIWQQAGHEINIQPT